MLILTERGHRVGNKNLLIAKLKGLASRTFHSDICGNAAQYNRINAAALMLLVFLAFHILLFTSDEFLHDACEILRRSAYLTIFLLYKNKRWCMQTYQQAL